MVERQRDSSRQGNGYSRLGIYSAAFPLLLFASVCKFWPDVVNGAVFEMQWAWMPSLDLYLRFRIDGLGILFSLIITGVGFFVTLYSAGYMAGHPHVGRFFFFLHAFMISMLGLVAADNLLLLYVFWEGTTVFSYLLIGFDHESETARDNARQAILVTAGGGLALLFGILLLKSAGVSFTISEWVESNPAIRSHALYPFILFCVLLGALTKSAQFPFHFWLPNAMSAPTPISAFLHAATMVKAGIYLLFRFHPLLGGTQAWMGTLVLVGGITAVWGSIQALGPKDLKRMLAYTTMMALGILTMFLGGQTTPTLTAAATFLLVHALYKAALFLAVGSIDHETGTRLVDQLGGLWRLMPLTALAVAAATLSMAGFPLFFGFIGKEIMYKGALAEESFPLFATAAAVLSNGLMTAVAGMLFFGPFTGKRPSSLETVHEAPWIMRLGPICMGGFGILFGTIPWWVSANLIQPAVHAMHPIKDEIKLALFYGFNTPLLLSVITVTAGVLIYHFRRPLGSWIQNFMERLPFTSQNVYQNGLDRFLKTADIITRGLQNGSLHVYLSVVMICMIAAVGGPWIGHLFPAFRIPLLEGYIFELGIVLLIAAATLVVVTSKTRLVAIGGLSGVGAGVALVFLVFGAPDIALTQLLVETLTVIIASLILLRLPPLSATKKMRGLRRTLNAAVSLSAGLLVASLLMAIGLTPVDRGITDFFEAYSYTMAHGRNIVNVILVDFRSLDTLGEIAVVVMAAWAGVFLIRGKGER